MQLPADHHYVRYCSPSQIQDGRVLKAAFVLRDRDKDTGLSGDHFEHFDSLEGDNYALLLTALYKRSFSVKPSGGFAKLNSRTVIGKMSHLSFEKPDNNSSHTLMKGLDKDDGMAPELLAVLVSEIKPIRSITVSP